MNVGAAPFEADTVDEARLSSKQRTQPVSVHAVLFHDSQVDFHGGVPFLSQALSFWMGRATEQWWVRVISRHRTAQ